MGNQNLLPVRDSSTKTILEGAKVVISLSSYVDGTLMARSSGFFINWDEESKVCTVLTSARLICSKYSSMDQWLGSDEYSPDATVSSHTNLTVVSLLVDIQSNNGLLSLGFCHTQINTCLAHT
jgi:hypothetical protein